MKTMTRRSLLAVGVAGTVAAGELVASDGHRTRRWLHSAGLLAGPDLVPPSVSASVEYHELSSPAMRAPVAWGLSVPARAVQAVLVCLHGRGSSQRFAYEAIGVHRFVARLGLPWVVASPNGGPASYWHARADGTDAQRMVFADLVPVLRERFGSQPIGLLGWSMGGYGALLAAADHPADVRAVAASSPAVWGTFSQSAPGAFDGAADFERHNLFSRVAVLRDQRIRIDCGDDDPFVGAVRKLAGRLPAAEVELGAGFHEAATWRARLPRQLTFLRRALAE